MKRSLKILVALFALFIATTGFAKTTQAKQDVSVTEQNTAVSQGASRAANDVGYLHVTINGNGKVLIGYYDETGNYQLEIFSHSDTIVGLPGNCSVYAAPGYIITQFSGSTTIVAGQTGNLILTVKSEDE